MTTAAPHPNLAVLLANATLITTTLGLAAAYAIHTTWPTLAGLLTAVFVLILAIAVLAYVATAAWERPMGRHRAGERA
jgi:hypothetical protein